MSLISNAYAADAAPAGSGFEMLIMLGMFAADLLLYDLPSTSKTCKRAQEPNGFYG